jgi:multiple sugar transport system substrate-binding protein
METSPKQAFQNVFQNGTSISKAVSDAQTQIDKDMKSGSFTSVESKYAFYDEAAARQ